MPLYANQRPATTPAASSSRAANTAQQLGEGRRKGEVPQPIGEVGGGAEGQASDEGLAASGRGRSGFHTFLRLANDTRMPFAESRRGRQRLGPPRGVLRQRNPTNSAFARLRNVRLFGQPRFAQRLKKMLVVPWVLKGGKPAPNPGNRIRAGAEAQGLGHLCLGLLKTAHSRKGRS
jgi:hypothetical protein